ncbi:Rieske (2Fe-2S) protein [Pyxidicoccus sp. MSG2]|uniref:Rieske (2Fe-2S) protein n=1 Tax=Pyxidicoccus sp. MSG2 TaxID=2996790 RepID=UPI0022715AFD|nr:Rieske 2Fe-2S domain-containing protein [Pyxidicoccus sp. MSG2]MCY1018666.1 Rieske 2Fe-2S domain-containing protein [Pyxidicoccus sp. MSG2]
MSFDPRQVNFLQVGAERYFLLDPGDGPTVLANGSCPHRGGPLHLGRMEDGTQAVYCPWHVRKVPLRHLQKTALPLVLRRDGAVAILPDTQAAVLMQKKTILAGASRPCEAVAPLAHAE